MDGRTGIHPTRRISTPGSALHSMLFYGRQCTHMHNTEPIISHNMRVRRRITLRPLAPWLGLGCRTRTDFNDRQAKCKGYYPAFSVPVVARGALSYTPVAAMHPYRCRSSSIFCQSPAYTRCSDRSFLANLIPRISFIRVSSPLSANIRYLLTSCSFGNICSGEYELVVYR